MDQIKSPEQRAEERYPPARVIAAPDEPGWFIMDAPHSTHFATVAQAEIWATLYVKDKREGYATCEIEMVTPRDKMIQELVDAIIDNARHRLSTEGEEGDTVKDFLNMTFNEALAKAKDQFGIVPTNP